jgi:phage-related protein
MRWKVEYYDIKVMKSIRQWPVGIEAKFARIVGLIEEFGPEGIGMPHVKALGQGLFEIRVKATEGIGRVFLCSIKGKVIIVLHEFIKKTQKTPKKDMDLARKRMKEVKDYE